MRRLRQARITGARGVILGVMVALVTAIGLSGCAEPGGDKGKAALRPKVEEPRDVVEPVWLVGRLSRAEMRGLIRLVDIRPRASFEIDHVRGAVWLDRAEWIAAARSRDAGFENVASWRKRIDDLGVFPTATVVVYDEGLMTEAARFWFILQYFGVLDTAVVNGGYAALGPLLPATLIESGPPRPPARIASHLQAPPVGQGSVSLVDRAALRMAIGRHDVQVLDARTVAEYAGRDTRKNPRAGHLPGAVNLPHEQLLDGSGRLRSPDELRKLLADAGLRPGERIVTHCDGGGRASLAALAVCRAGFGPVENYYLSFADWAADDACPIESPASGPVD